MKTLIEMGDKGSGKPYFEDLILYFGPTLDDPPEAHSPDDKAAHQVWYTPRDSEVRALLLPDEEGVAPLFEIMELGLVQEVEQLFATAGLGMIRGGIMPILRIDLLNSRLDDTRPVFRLIQKDHAREKHISECALAITRMRWASGLLVGDFAVARFKSYN